tara:strand:+ start:230 stop:1225 length:996 start_codon:yes stop_codon:yes gene_type:complete
MDLNINEITFNKIDYLFQYYDKFNYTDTKKLKAIIISLYDEKLEIGYIKTILKQYFEIYSLNSITNDLIDNLLNEFNQYINIRQNTQQNNTSQIVYNIPNNLISELFTQMINQNNENVTNQPDENIINQSDDDILNEMGDENVINQSDEQILNEMGDENIINQSDEQILNEMVDENVINESDEEILNEMGDENAVQNIFNNYYNNSTNPNNINMLSNNIINLMNSIIDTTPETHINNIIPNTNQEDIPLILDQNELNKLKKYKYKNICEELKANNILCPISMDEYNDEDYLRELPCKHIFKCENIDKWLLENSHKCPVCRVSAGKYKPKMS